MTKFTLGIAPLVCLALSAPIAEGAEKRVYSQWGLATATVGFDSSARRTLVAKYYLVATGPATIEDAAAGIVSACLSGALKGAAEAFKSTPSPELGARMAAALGSFKVSSYGCLQTKAITRGLKKSFDLALVERQEFLNGLVLKFSAESPSASQYAALNRELRKYIRGDGGRMANKIVDLYASMQNFNFDINLGHGDGAALVMKAMDGRKIQLATSTAADIVEFAQHPLDGKNAERLVKNIVSLAVDKKASLEEVALQSAGIPDAVAKKLAHQMKEAAHNPQVREALKTAIVPQVALAKALDDVPKIAQNLTKAGGKVVTASGPTVSVGGTKVVVTPVGPVPKKLIPH